ncbi:MAG TPA: helix-turn-helix transcriptional regulator, partial [Actinospica sp.]|nr:helix-turn-helix transcriptional regulator [Actinospica sp.]
GPETAAQAAEEAPEADAVLSDAERRVAVLAAAGHTNRQIAHKLYITVSTVEQHLTKIYRKLSVSRRSELVTRLT